MASKTVYVGNLPSDVRRSEVEDLFAKYGRIRDVDLKNPTRPPAFAFIEFDSSRDAEDAVRGRDGYDFDGNRLRVEMAQGRGRGGFGGGGGRGFGGGFGGPPPFAGGYGGGGGGGGFGGGGRGGVSRQTGYRLVVSGLPQSASWQDLKDTCRRYGDVTFTQVMRDSRDRTIGIVDFATKDDMKYALRKLDDTEFKNPFDRAYIRVKEERGRSRSRSRSRRRSPSSSRSRSRSRSRSYSSRSRSASSRSKSRSKSPRSKSRSRSRSASPAKPDSRSASPAANGAKPEEDADAKESPQEDKED